MTEGTGPAGRFPPQPCQMTTFAVGIPLAPAFIGHGAFGVDRGERPAVLLQFVDQRSGPSRRTGPCLAANGADRPDGFCAQQTGRPAGVCLLCLPARTCQRE